VAERLTDVIAEWAPERIVEFNRTLWGLMARSYRADLWAAAYVIRGGCSDDSFDYFRGWLIAQGRDAFERAMENPDSLADVPAVQEAAAEGFGDGLECEDVLGIGWDAYRRATGEKLPGSPINLPDLDPDWSFDFDDEDEMERRLPRITALFYDAS
jgi:hypothetical protein